MARAFVFSIRNLVCLFLIAIPLASKANNIREIEFLLARIERKCREHISVKKHLQEARMTMERPFPSESHTCPISLKTCMIAASYQAALTKIKHIFNTFLKRPLLPCTELWNELLTLELLCADVAIVHVLKAQANYLKEGAKTTGPAETARISSFVIENARTRLMKMCEIMLTLGNEIEIQMVNDTPFKVIRDMDAGHSENSNSSCVPTPQ
ncbi:uncharacterized protein NEMAJ01_1707 [Nematocida major]|uniref:uncharacterized protein n=1 Tax=Nematocida major TaxID=1912982 RepID=UPI0020089EF2|nr:uncharacterized protein NEMAJ01_1707 [Nematocida major]KAH9386811.1 hypothetical protein NEMAJ01_1707 [Nematocida major]